MDGRPCLTIVPNGPYAITGVSAITVLVADSRTEFREVQLAGGSDHVEVCRCGHTSRAPLCDRTGETVRFAAVPAGREPPLGRPPPRCG
jgi:CDGSH-type Zn-finger protein